MNQPNYAPLYCALYPELAQYFRSHGYSLAIHGSLQRDFDLIAIPWVDYPTCPVETVQILADKYNLTWQEGDPVMKPHNRWCWTLSISWGECFIDLSVIAPEA